MKTIEEKAKAYDEALKRAKEVIGNQNASTIWKDWLKNTFSELMGSGNEKIRKNLITFFKDEYGTHSNAYFAGIKVKDILAWLEKQQKSTWSEEDEKILDDIIEEVRPFGECPDYPTDEDREYYYGHSKMIDWLKSLKQRIGG